MHNQLMEMFSYPFMVRAILVGVLVSLCASMLGVSLVLKRYSMIGDGLSHVGFGALAVAAALNLAPLAVALPVVVIAAFLLLRLSESGKIKGDAAIAVISTGALAVGVMVISMTTGMNADLNSYLFGSILAIRQEDVLPCVVLTTVVLALYLLFFNQIFAVTFDEPFARATGMKTNTFHMLLAVLTAVTVVLGMRLMGALLISSLIIFPALTAMRVCKSYRAVVICAVVLSVFTLLAGITISFLFATPTGASIVMVDIILFAVSGLAGLRSKRSKRSISSLLLVLLMSVTLTACTGRVGAEGSGDGDGGRNEADTAGNMVEEVGLKVHFIDVGQADCILAESEGEFLLMDAGNREDRELILDYLDACGITTLSYVIGSHPHEDHIGSLAAVIEKYEIGTLIMPEKAANTEIFEDVLDAVERKNLSITAPRTGQTYELGGASFTILAPNRDYGDDINNWSVGIRLTDGSNSFVMCADAEEEAEADILDSGLTVEADVLKLGHHGSVTSTSDAFLEAVIPSGAVIMCGKDNSYGHPHREVVEKLEKSGIEVFRADEQGTVIALSDGQKVTFTIGSASEDGTLPGESVEEGMAAGDVGEEEDTIAVDGEDDTIAADGEEDTIAVDGEDDTIAVDGEDDTIAADGEEETRDSHTEVYITKTGSKYHKAGCRHLGKSEIAVSMETAGELGLEPCGTCSPRQPEEE